MAAFSWLKRSGTAGNALRKVEELESVDVIPQAQTDDPLIRVMERDWREHFTKQLKGRGLEIGPLHRPLPQHTEMEIDYIDRFTVDELRHHYPELNELPLVEPDLLGDAQTLEGIDDRAYDFVSAAHVIEHMRNPIRALAEWCRVVRPGGLIYLIAPDKRVTFDRHRVRTTLEHMILDYLLPSQERDYEHYLDYAIHVHKKVGLDAVDEADDLISRDYSIHYHTFIPSDLYTLCRWVNDHVRPLEMVEGPVMSPGSDEFHLLVRVAT